MKTSLAMGLILCLAVGATAWVLFVRQNAAAARQFAREAEEVRSNTNAAVDFFKHIAARREAPTDEELRAWEDRNTRIDAAAEQAARHLRPAARRRSALRWLETQRALRSARVASRVIVVSRILFDYCTERQQFVAQAVRSLTPPARAAALGECFDQQPRAAGGPATTRTEIERLEADESRAWAALVALTPQIGK